MVAKRLDKHWAQTGVKSLQDIRDALGSGVAAGMSMADRIEHQAAIKKWKESLSKDDLHKMFRMIEEIKNGRAREQYRTTDDALAKLRAASDDLLPSERVRAARFPEGEKMTVEEVAAVVGPEFEDMHENPPESVKKKRKEMEEAMGEDHTWDQGFTALLPSEHHASRAAASYLDMFFKEKRIPSKVFEVKDSQGITHSIPNKVVIDMIKQTRGHERASIENTLRKIDYGNGDVNHFLAFLAKGLAESYKGALRLGSQQEAEKLQAEAEANEQQANADRAKAEAAQMRTAGKPSGLYGYTKGTQNDVEASVRKAQRRAASVAKALYARDERSVSFLQAHAKRANSKTARLILAAMKAIGPRVASDKSAALELPSERRASIFHGSPKEQLEYVVDALQLADGQGLRVQELPRKGALSAQRLGFAKAERGQLFITPKGKSVRLASEEKIAGGLYGHPTKTARLALVACSDLRAYVGEVAFSLHSRRTAKYAKMTGFLKEHSKKTRCAYSRMLLDCYPDAPVAKLAATPGAVVEAIHSGISNVRSQAGLSMSDDDEDSEAMFWQGEVKKASALRPSEMIKRAFVPDSIGGWIEWEDGTRTAAKERRA
jgi:hypothetical protein